MRARIRSWRKVHVNQQNPDVIELVPPPPDHAGWLSIRLGEQAGLLAGPQDRPIDPSFWGRYRPSHKNTLFDPFQRARSANTIGPIAPKLCRPRDLAQNLEDIKSERRASTLAPTTLPQKCTPEFAAGASFVWAYQNLQSQLRSQKWSCRTQTMPADFPYVRGSRPHLWQAPRTARSTRRFGGLGVTCTTSPNPAVAEVVPRGRHEPQTMRTDFQHDWVTIWVSRLHLKFNIRLGGLAPPKSQSAQSVHIDIVSTIYILSVHKVWHRSAESMHWYTTCWEHSVHQVCQMQTLQTSCTLDSACHWLLGVVGGPAHGPRADVVEPAAGARAPVLVAFPQRKELLLAGQVAASQRRRNGGVVPCGDER